jgi:hypothetical protein
MKIRILATTGLIALLAACGGTAGNETNAAEPATNETAAKPEAAPTPAPAAAGDLSTMSEAYLVGRWAGPGEDCADATEFRADGTLHGNIWEGERWTLEGDRLTLVGMPDPLVVARVDENHMTTTNPQGTARTVTRCTG